MILGLRRFFKWIRSSLFTPSRTVWTCDWVTCPRCQGFGETLSHFDCYKCGGSGRVATNWQEIPREPSTPTDGEAA